MTAVELTTEQVRGFTNEALKHCALINIEHLFIDYERFGVINYNKIHDIIGLLTPLAEQGIINHTISGVKTECEFSVVLKPQRIIFIIIFSRRVSRLFQAPKREREELHYFLNIEKSD